MRYLQVTGIDGADLQLVDDDGEQFALTVTDQVRSSVNSAHGDDSADVTARPSLRTVDTEPAATDAVPQVADVPALPPGELVTPRTVQELLRAGHSAPQVAAAANWELSKVERYAAPIEAERSYIAGLVQDLPVGAASGESVGTVGDRIGARLQDRGVDASSVEWDAYRRAGLGWVVVCRFSAGGRSREASWDFRPATRSLTAIDDEARWLGEDERGGTAGPIPIPARPVKVFDVEAEGGVTEPAEPADLVSAMQARSRDRRARNRRTSTTRHQDGPVVEAPNDGIAADQTSVDASQVPVPAKPTVDELGHDPITGTVDLFRAVPVAAQSPQDPDNGEAPAIDVALSPIADSEDEDSAADQGLHDYGVSMLDESDIAEEPDEAANSGPEADEGPDNGAVAGVQDTTDATSERPTPPTRPGGSRSGRPSVPSWDDIMFGGRRGRD